MPIVAPTTSSSPVYPTLDAVNAALAAAAVADAVVDAATYIAKVTGLVANSTSAATANTAAIRAAVNAGGWVLINTPGIVYVNDASQIPNYTTVEIGGGVTLTPVNAEVLEK